MKTTKKEDLIFFLEVLATELKYEIFELNSQFELACEEIRDILSLVISSKKEQLLSAISQLAEIKINHTARNRFAVTQ